jgi:glycosyltransferase involved in cell wall biosynthesis
MNGKNKFVFVAPMYNASAYVQQMLFSIFGQSYDNWHLILIDDVSNVNHLKKSEEIINSFVYMGSSGTYAARHTNEVNGGEQIMHSSKVTLIKNSEKKWEVANVLKGISMCDDEDIICRIDADDWLTDLDALAMIDATYTQTGCEALWTMHRWGFSDKNISGPMSIDADPYQHPWVSSHLKTFRKRLLNNVKDENFKAEDGNYIKRAGDQAIYLPVLKNTKKRIFMPRCLYHYTIKDVPETYQTPDAKFQRDEAIFLRQRGYVK